VPGLASGPGEVVVTLHDAGLFDLAAEYAGVTSVAEVVAQLTP
jgi:hypothetical protein